MKKLSIDEYVLLNYKEKTNAQMAVELGCSKSTISDRRKKLGISATELNKELREKVPYICKQYGRKTKTTIAKELNCSAAFIKKVWMENGLTGLISQIYSLKEDYFSIINSFEKAYWVGFIAADGCIYRRDGHQGMLSIAVQKDDIELLEYFKEELDTTKPIQIQDNMATLQITSDKICNDLLEKGIGVRKTFDLSALTVLNNIPEQYHSSFFLGYFDGDGSIDIPQNIISKGHVRIAGPITNLTTFSKILLDNNIPNSILLDKRKNTQPFGSLEFKNTTEKYCFLKYIYSSEIKCLTRKKERSFTLIQRIEDNITNRSENKKAVEHYKSVVLKRGELLER